MCSFYYDTGLKFNFCTKCVDSPSDTLEHARCPPCFQTMHAWMTSQLNVSLISIFETRKGNAFWSAIGVGTSQGT